VTTLALAAVSGLDGEGSVTSSADHLFALVGSGESGEGGLNLDRAETHAATEAEDQVEGGLLLDVVVGEGAAVLQLLSGEDETLLIGGDTLLVLDLGLDVVDGVGGLDVEGDGLPSECLDKNLRRREERGTCR